MNEVPVMKSSIALLALSATLASFGAFADNSPSTYEYGMPLHVPKVVSLTEPPTQLCKVVTADMKYIDNAGKPEEISYRKLSDACNFQN